MAGGGGGGGGVELLEDKSRGHWNAKAGWGNGNVVAAAWFILSKKRVFWQLRAAVGGWS